MNAIVFLKQIEKLREVKCRKEKEIERCRTKATRVTSQLGGERVQASGSMSKMADESIKIADLQKEIEVIEDTIADVIRVIEMLGRDEYIVLHGIYVEQMPVVAIAEYEGKSQTWAYQKRKKGIAEVQEILDGKR